MKQPPVKSIRLLLAALFISYYCSSTMFYHTHEFSWGKVTHSHPLIPGKEHSHTAAQCQTIDYLSLVLFTDIAAGFLLLQVFDFIKIFIRIRTFVPKVHFLNISLRAPPAPTL